MADDPKANPHEQRIAELAAKHAEEVIDALVDVMRNPKSRQRVNAAKKLAELMCLTGPAVDQVARARGAGLGMTREEALKYWREQQAKKASSSNDT